MTEDNNHIGVYVHGTQDTALFTILLPDNTCGMFLTPSASDVFWLGFTKYTINGNKLLFKIQNPEMKASEQPVQKKDSGDDISADMDIDAQFLEATLTPTKEYIQHGSVQDTKFIFMTPDVSFWEKLGSWKKIGEARHMKDMEDFDVAHEIRKLLSMVISRFGKVFVWA